MHLNKHSEQEQLYEMEGIVALEQLSLVQDQMEQSNQRQTRGGQVRHKPSPSKSKSARDLVQVKSKSGSFPHKSDLNPSPDLSPSPRTQSDLDIIRFKGSLLWTLVSYESEDR